MSASLATLKKGDTVILHMFTGIAVGVKEVLAADKNTVTLETRVGTAKFSRKTGKQVEPKAKSERFANYITEDDGSYVPANKSKPAPAKKTAKAKAKPAKDEEEDEDEEEEKPVKKPVKKAPAKKAPAKKPSKKAPVEDEDEDFDEDDYEEEE